MKKLLQVLRSDLITERIGGTISKSAKIIKKAEGGALFVDEAYTLCSPTPPPPPLPSAILERRLMIFARYKEQMNDFLKMNPGLTRRVKTVLNFENVTPEELCDITKCKILQQFIRVPLGIAK